MFVSTPVRVELSIFPWLNHAWSEEFSVPPNIIEPLSSPSPTQETLTCKSQRRGKGLLQVVNNRPRGLETLLDHLLDKRIQIRHKLSNTKIPENLVQKKI